jgi:hypothetical protein
MDSLHRGIGETFILLLGVFSGGRFVLYEAGHFVEAVQKLKTKLAKARAKEETQSAA